MTILQKTSSLLEQSHSIGLVLLLAVPIVLFAATFLRDLIRNR